jgi:hypothetical protein
MMMTLRQSIELAKFHGKTLSQYVYERQAASPHFIRFETYALWGRMWAEVDIERLRNG